MKFKITMINDTSMQNEVQLPRTCFHNDGPRIGITRTLHYNDFFASRLCRQWLFSISILRSWRVGWVSYWTFRSWHVGWVSYWTLRSWHVGWVSYWTFGVIDNHTWTACNLVLLLPIPSTVVTAHPCNDTRGAKHAFTE